MKKLIVAFLGVLLVGAPALAQTLVYDKNNAISLRRLAEAPYMGVDADAGISYTRGLIMDEDCADADSLDADLQPVPNGVDFTPATGNQDDGFDAFDEAINPKLNWGYGPQTSGVADGWCDEAPWVLAGDITVDGNEQIIIGPFLGDLPGFQLIVEITAMTGTSFQPQMAMHGPFDPSLLHQLGAGTASTATSGVDQWVFGTWLDGEANNSQVTATDSPSLHPSQIWFLRMSMVGAGNYDWSIAIEPLYGPSQYPPDRP
jgi:hypothetical protein